MMTSYTLGPPAEHESAEYYKHYIRQVSETDVIEVLTTAQAATVALLRQIPAGKWDYRYASGKWTVRELLIHLIDSERIFAYRALRIARNDPTPMPGFEQDDYVPHSGAGMRSPESIIEEYQVVRQATLHLFRNFDEAMWLRMGTASGKPFSPRAIAFVIAGHERHHLSILKTRYLTTS